MGGRAGQRQDQTQTTQLPADQQANVDMLMSGARDYYRTGGPQYFPGQTYAGTDPNTTAGREAGLGYSRGIGGNLANAAVSGDTFFLDPNNIYNPDRIPGFARAKQGVVTDATNNLTRNILPQIRSGSVADGVYGGSRQGIAEGLAASETSRGIGDTLARMDMDAYNSGLGMYNAAASRAPTTYGLGLAPGNTQATIGEANRQDSQRGIDANLARWNFEQLAPLLNLQNFQGLTGTAGQYGGTTTGSTTGNLTGGQNSWMAPLGTILSLAGMFGGGG